MGKESKIGNFFKKIGKSGVLKKILGAGGDVLSGNIPGAIQKLLSSGELSPEEAAIALEMHKLDLQDVQDARKNETLRDTSEHSSWLSKNVHELIAIFLVVGWLVFKAFLPGVITTDIEQAVMLILAYLFGRPDKRSKNE